MKYRYNITLVLFWLAGLMCVQAQTYQLAVLKYRGGGDWYANLETSLPNLIAFSNQNLQVQIQSEQAIVDVGSPQLFRYPFVHMTGHGNVVFNDQETENLRKYLLGGGFLHIDDNYGMDPFIRKEMKKVFPELDWILLPPSHPIYHQTFDFPRGIPKIHEHDNQNPAGLGLIHEGRLICFYSFEADLGDGWEDAAVHNDPEEKRLQALRMGANLIQYVFMGDGLDEE